MILYCVQATATSEVPNTSPQPARIVCCTPLTGYSSLSTPKQQASSTCTCMPRLTTACDDCAALGPLASQRSLGVHSPRLDNDHWHPACRDASCGAQLRRNLHTRSAAGINDGKACRAAGALRSAATPPVTSCAAVRICGKSTTSPDGPTTIRRRSAAPSSPGGRSKMPATSVRDDGAGRAEGGRRLLGAL